MEPSSGMWSTCGTRTKYISYFKLFCCREILFERKRYWLILGVIQNSFYSIRWSCRGCIAETAADGQIVDHNESCSFGGIHTSIMMGGGNPFACWHFLELWFHPYLGTVPQAHRHAVSTAQGPLPCMHFLLWKIERKMRNSLEHVSWGGGLVSGKQKIMLAGQDDETDPLRPVPMQLA